MRTNKQLRADLSRINLENKTVRQAQQIIAKQYNKLGRKVPTKLSNGVATMRDMERYMGTLTRAVDRRIQKELINLGGVEGQLAKLNSIQNQRANIIRKHLSGYDSSVVEGYIKGGTLVLGRGITSNIPRADEYTLERIEKIAEFNKKSVEQWLDMKIKSTKQDLKNLKGMAKADGSDILRQIEELLAVDNIDLTDTNRRKIMAKLNTLDMLGREKLAHIMTLKQERQFYEIYKEELTHNRNSDLVQSIISDVNKSMPKRLQENVRLIE